MSHKSLERLVNASFLRGMKCVGWIIHQRLLAKQREGPSEHDGYYNLVDRGSGI